MINISGVNMNETRLTTIANMQFSTQSTHTANPRI